jgi:hypothetical protein
MAMSRLPPAVARKVPSGDMVTFTGQLSAEGSFQFSLVLAADQWDGGELPDGHERSLSCSWLHRSDRLCDADYYPQPPDFRSFSLPEFAPLLEW